MNEIHNSKFNSKSAARNNWHLRTSISGYHASMSLSSKDNPSTYAIMMAVCQRSQDQNTVQLDLVDSGLQKRFSKPVNDGVVDVEGGKGNQTTSS